MDSLYIQFTNAKEREDFIRQLLGGEKEPLAEEAVKTLKVRSSWYDPKTYDDILPTVTLRNLFKNKGVRFIRLLNSHEGKVGNWIMISLEAEARALKRKLYQLYKGAIYTNDEINEKCLVEQLEIALDSNDLLEADELIYALCHSNPWFFKANEHYKMGIKLAESFFDKGDLSKSAGWYQFLLEENPSDPQIYLGLGSVYMAAGDIESSLTYFLQGLYYNPGQVYLCYNACILLQSIGEIEAAVEEVEKALEKNPDNPLLNKLAGDLALYNIDRLEDALEYYKKALFSLTSDEPQELLVQLLNNYGMALAENGEIDVAEKVLNESYGLNSDREDTLLNLAAFYGFYAENPDRSINYSTKVLELDPESGKAHHNLGLAYLAKEDWPRARWHLYKARKLLPESYEPLNKALRELKVKRP